MDVSGKTQQVFNWILCCLELLTSLEQLGFDKNQLKKNYQQPFSKNHVLIFRN